MSGQTKKPLYKKWWIWLIVIVVIGGVLNLVTDEDEEKEVDKEPNQEVTNEETEKEEVKSVLSDEDVELIKSNLEDSLESDRELGDMFYLDDFEYNPDSNKILARIDMQQDPLPDTKEEIEEWSESHAWYLVEAIPDVEDDYNVTINLVSKVDDGYIAWGRTVYGFENKEYKFKADDGMKLYD